MAMEEDLIKAKLKLQYQKPFFGFLALKSKFAEDREMKNPMGISRDFVIHYNPDMLSNYDVEMLAFAITHEIMHVALGHFDRMEFRDNELWNVACDIVVNSELLNPEVLKKIYGFDYEGFLSNLGISNEDMFAEKVYDLLQGRSELKGKDLRKDWHGYESEGHMGDCEIAQALSDAYTASQLERGDLPSSLEKMFERLRKPIVDWRRMLNGIFTSLISGDFTYSRYSKKNHIVEDRKFKMPALDRDYESRVLVSVDVSGSIPSDDIERFISEIAALSKSRNMDGDVVFHDVQVTDRKKISEIRLPLKVKGVGGGTSHEWLVSEPLEKHDAVICFTDGYTEFPDLGKFKSKFHWFITCEEKFEELKGRNKLGHFHYYGYFKEH